MAAHPQYPSVSQMDFPFSGTVFDMIKVFQTDYPQIEYELLLGEL